MVNFWWCVLAFVLGFVLMIIVELFFVWLLVFRK